MPNTQQVMRHCRKCDQKTMHLQQRPQHLLHLVLSIITAGLWLIPWILISGSQKQPDCSQCGERSKDRVGMVIWDGLAIVIFLFGAVPLLVMFLL